MARKNRGPIELDISRVAHDGRGIAEHNGKVVFVHNALKGEKITARVLRSHRKYLDAVAIEHHQTAPERVAAPCDFFGICGGCSLQHLSAWDQIQLKMDLLKEQLDHADLKVGEFLSPLQLSQTNHYRTKARLGVRYVEKKGEVLVGFRELDGRKIAQMDDCVVLHQAISSQIPGLKDLIAKLSVMHKIPQITVAMGDAALVDLIFRHLEPLSDGDKALLEAYAKANPVRIYLQPGKDDSCYLFYPKIEKPHLEYRLEDQDITMHFQPRDFTQVNLKMNQKMLNQALDCLALKANDQVLDLFCGLGNFSLAMAQKAKQVDGFEACDKMVLQAGKNAQRNGLDNVFFHRADLYQETIDFDFKNFPYNKVLLDPPRSGAKEIIPALNHNKIEKMVYVSCQLSSLVRDLKTLVGDYGYRIEKIGLLDMFTHTAHVETMALLVKDS